MNCLTSKTIITSMLFKQAPDDSYLPDDWQSAYSEGDLWDRLTRIEDLELILKLKCSGCRRVLSPLSVNVQSGPSSPRERAVNGSLADRAYAGFPAFPAVFVDWGSPVKSPHLKTGQPYLPQPSIKRSRASELMPPGSDGSWTEKYGFRCKCGTYHVIRQDRLTDALIRRFDEPAVTGPRLVVWTDDIGKASP